MSSFVLKLRVAAAAHPNVLRKRLLRDVAEDIDKAVKAFSVCPTGEVLGVLNAHWARAHRQLMLAEAELGKGASA